MENTFKTKDLAESSFLLAKGKLIERIEREGKTCWFIFSDSQECQELVNDFWFKNSLIPAKSYYEAIQTLKNRIFS